MQDVCNLAKQSSSAGQKLSNIVIKQSLTQPNSYPVELSGTSTATVLMILGDTRKSEAFDFYWHSLFLLIFVHSLLVQPLALFFAFFY